LFASLLNFLIGENRRKIVTDLLASLFRYGYGEVLRCIAAKVA
jgi:hypothetical protein